MTNYDVLTELLRENGMDYKWTKMFVKKLRDDEMAFPMSDEEKNGQCAVDFFPEE